MKKLGKPGIEVVTIPAGENVALLKIELCLKPGTEAGEYPLTAIE